jgi:uncharacterized OB-fold protein
LSYRYSERKEGRCKRCNSYINPEQDLCERCLSRTLDFAKGGFE